MTTSIEIKGACKIIEGAWKWKIHQTEHILCKDDKSFHYCCNVDDFVGWHSIRLYHLEHSNSLTRIDTQGHILDYSYVDIQHVLINKIRIPHNLLLQSNMSFTNPVTNKSLWHKKLGEPFIGKINLYLPIDHWTFAVLENHSHSNWTNL